MNPQLFPQSSTPGRTPSSSNAPSPQPPSSDGLSPPATGPLAGIERALYHLLCEKLPQIPIYIRDMLADYLPWLVLITAMVMLPVLVVILINSGVIGIITSISTINSNPAYWATLVLFFVQFTLVCFGVWQLFLHRRRGWQLLFFAALIGGLSAISQIFSQFSNPFISTPVFIGVDVIMLYLLFQVRGYFIE